MRLILIYLFRLSSLFICFIFLNCDGKPILLEESFINDNEDMFIISPILDEIRIVDLSEHMDSLKYVKLELTDESLIGEITKIEVFEERIYILDYQTATLFVFSIEGKYLFKINQLGGGPGEYITLDFFHLDRDKRRIYLTDLVAYFIMEYDLEGNYISRAKIPFNIRGIVPVSDERYFIYSNYVNNQMNLPQEFNLFYTDNTFTPMKGYFPYDSKLIGKAARQFANPEQGNFYCYDNHSYIFDLYSETVFKIGTEELIPHIRFDFNGLGFDKEYLQKDPDILDEYIRKKSFYKVSQCYENNNFIFYKIGTSVGYWTGIYSKNTDTNIVAAGLTIGEDFINFNIYGTYDSWLVSFTSVEVLFFKKENYSKRKHSGKFIHITEEFIQDVDIEDNPVLVFYKLKDF